MDFLLHENVIKNIYEYTLFSYDFSDNYCYHFLDSTENGSQTFFHVSEKADENLVRS